MHSSCSGCSRNDYWWWWWWCNVWVAAIVGCWSWLNLINSWLVRRHLSSSSKQLSTPLVCHLVFTCTHCALNIFRFFFIVVCTGRVPLVINLTVSRLCILCLLYEEHCETLRHYFRPVCIHNGYYCRRDIMDLPIMFPKSWRNSTSLLCWDLQKFMRKRRIRRNLFATNNSNKKQENTILKLARSRLPEKQKAIYAGRQHC